MSYYTEQNLNGNVSQTTSTNEQKVPWYTGDKIGPMSRDIKTNQDVYDTELYQILFESDGAYNIIEDAEYGDTTIYTLYFLKTKHSKLIGIITQDKFEPKSYKVVYEFEFEPRLIFDYTVLEVLGGIIHPFLFQIPTDGPWKCDSYNSQQILDELRAQAIMILLESPTYNNVAKNFKRLLLDKVIF